MFALKAEDHPYLFAVFIYLTMQFWKSLAVFGKTCTQN